MKLGTRSYLFGVHNFFIHPFMVLVSWVVLYQKKHPKVTRLPNLGEVVAVFLHDIGYIGVEDTKGPEGDKHPERGARVIKRLFKGKRGGELANLILHHSAYYNHDNGNSASILYYPDKYWHILMPGWLYWLLGSLSGELKYYMALGNRRALKADSFAVWYRELRGVSLKKIKGDHLI